MRALARSVHFAPRRTIRVRLTLFYGGLFLVSGAALLAITYLLARSNIAAGAAHNYTPITAQARHAAIAGSKLISPSRPASVASVRVQDVGQRTADLNQLLVVSGIALIVTALVSIGLGWLVAGRVLDPLRTITASARDISATSLDRRLNLAGPDDELKELGDTFDDLLTRLERSFRSQRQFVANASHELRTPLTLERALLEAVMTDPDATTESLMKTCERVHLATGQQERLIDALLTLAISERGIERAEPFDLAVLADQTIALRQTDAERHGVTFDAALAPAPTMGDPELAERLVTNLIDNAVRYNIPGGRIEVVTGERSGAATIRVSNTGPAVPTDEVDDLFEPFRRLGNKRTRHSDGHGLGLSIVAAIATAHHADLIAHARQQGGLDIQVRFPAPPTHTQTGTPERATTLGSHALGNQTDPQPVRRVVR
jgi:signal transduction histidine kinase